MNLPQCVIDEYIEINNSLVTDRSVHVIFQHGTVIIIDDDPLPTDALPFTRSYIDAWPVDRLDAAADLEHHMGNAAAQYADSCRKWGTAYPYSAITALTGSPYPDAGPAATRTISTTANGRMHMIAYPHDMTLLNLVDGSVECEAALVLGGECRRLDWMFPNIIEIIRPV